MHKKLCKGIVRFDFVRDDGPMQSWMRLGAGVALLAFAVYLLVVRVRIRRRASQQSEAPKRRLMVYAPSAPGEQGMIDLSGTVVNPPALRAPVSGKPCALWEVTLYAIQPATYDSDEGHQAVWTTGRGSDLVVAYDERRDLTEIPKRGRPSFVVTGGGRVEIPGDKVVLRLPGESDKPTPGISWILSDGPQPANPAVLEEIGLPEEWLTRVRANPAGFLVAEGCITTGEFVRLAQAPGRSDDYYVYPLSQELIGSIGGGCAGALLAVIAVCAAVPGALLVYRAVADLAF